MLNAKIKPVRIANLTPAHRTMNTTLTAAGQTLAALAGIVGVTQDLAERQLSLLVDESLCTRTKGSRTTALYAGA
jgi:hypothetical protein